MSLLFPKMFRPLMRHDTHTMDTKAVVFLALVATAIAGPLSNQDKCSTRCTDSMKFRYAPGTTYTYDYRVDTATSMSGASEDTAKMTLQTVGDIEVLSPCEFSLQMRNTRLFHTDGNGNMKTADREVQFRSGLEAYPLRFSYQDGNVEHVCPSDGDHAWTMNLKKGFLSALQNTMDDLTQSQNVTETDVAGTCKTEYTVASNGYYVTSLKKSKDILTCTDRHSFETMIQATPYLIPSDIQSLPLMKTTHECEQSIEVGGILKSAVCSESHVYRPFANGMSGGSTTVTQKLTYQTYKRSLSSRVGSVGVPKTLTFDHKATQPTKDQARRSVEQKLTDICDSTSYDIRPESPRLFTELSMAMRSLDADDMEDIYRLLKTKTMCPSNDKTYKFFLDALPMTNTGASVRVMAKLINNGDVEGLQANAWLTSLAFIAQPTSEMILEMKSLIDNQNVREDAMLPVSSVINNYCKVQSSCDRDYAVLSVVSSFERTIGSRCDASGKKFNDILLALRAIGNAGHATRAVNVLNKCMTMTSNPMEIRVAAIEAFRRMPCSVEDMHLWQSFMDKSVDSELRISAYMAIMRCPSESILEKMASILSEGEDEQVGSFVYSHLTNLKESSNPHKQQVADMINNLVLNKDFDMGLFKVSRNYEASTMINKLNTGFTAESNMIWSSSDQMPRSLSGNLTIELFGQSINVFDFGGRLEGLEYLMKSVIGPYINAEEKAEKEVDFDQVQGSVFGRVFGNEMFFVHSKTAKSPLGKMPSKWLDVLIKLAKKQQLALTQNVQFIDASLVIPSSAGLPIHMHVNGSATVDLSVNGKMDLRKVGASPRSMDVDGEIRPSAALEVTGTMTVDAFVTKTGLRMRNTLHSSTSLKGRIQLNRGQQLNIELETPEEKMEIFGAKSQFYILHNEIEQEQEMIKENRKEFKKCTGTTFTSITGMEICQELSFANASLKADGPYFPLTGPTSFSVTLFKRDTHSGYKFFAKRNENKKASIAQLSVATPGSKVNRAITVDFTLNYAKQSMEINMFSPWKKTEMKGDLINKKGMKSFSGSMVIDDVHKYALTSEVKTVQGKNKIQLSPMIEVKRPGAANVQLVGLIALEKPWKLMSMDVTLTGIQKLPCNLKTTIVNSKKEKSLKASFSTDTKNVYSIEASNKMNVMGKKSTIAYMKSKFNVNTPKTQLVSISGHGDYRQDKSLKMDATVALYRLMKKPASFKVSLVKKNAKKGSLSVILKSSKMNVRIGSNMVMKPNGLVSTRSSFDYNIPKVHRNKITFTGKINDRSTQDFKKYSAGGILDVKRNPEYNVGFTMDVDHKTRHSKVVLDLSYGPNPKDKTKKIYLLTSLTKKIANVKNADIDYKINAQAPQHSVDLSLEGKHKHTPKLVDSKVQLKYGNNKGFNAVLLLRNQSSNVTKMNGKMNVEWPGTEYLVNTQLFQKSAKQYQHTLNFKSNDGTKHSLSTIYKNPKASAHDVRTELKLHKSKPITFIGSTTLNPRNFAATGKVTSGRDTYGVVTSSKISKAPNAKINIELIHPARRMTLDVSGGKNKNKCQGSVEASWDADNKESRVVLDGAYVEKLNKGAMIRGGNMNFRSPFENLEHLSTSFKYAGSRSEHNLDGKFSWGEKHNQIVSNMKVKKDLSLRNVDLSMELKTPFEGLRSAEINVDHYLADALKTVIRGKVEKEHVKLIIQGQDNSNGYKTDVKGNMAIKSSMKSAKNIAATFSHSLSDGILSTNAVMTHNGKKYEGALNMAHSGSGLTFKNNGDFMVKAPKQKITSKWAHKNTDKTMKSSLISSWGKDTLKVDFIGNHDLSNLREINGNLKIKSPWTSARNIEVALDHKHGSGLLKSNAVMKQNGKTRVSSMVNFQGDANTAGIDFELMTPMLEDLTGKLNVDFEKYPMTSSAEISWAPKKKMTVEGSLNIASWSDADINVKLTTPSRKYRNVLIKATNKIANDEAVSHMTLDYGVRQSIDFESRVGFGDQKKSVRVKLMSPFENLKSLDTGLSFDGYMLNFESKADFELLPSIGKFDTVVTWQYENDLNGKVRLNTPYQDYQYFELSTSSKMLDSKMRQSQLQLEHYPGKVYSFDSTYRFDLPLSFEATIRSPYPKYDNLGMSIKHTFGGSLVQSHGEITYLPGKTIESDLNVDFGKIIDGSILVKTPFRNFETNKITLKHNSQEKSVSTYGEVFVAKKKIVVDLNASWNKNIDGSLVVKTPFQNFESNQITLKHNSQKKSVSTYGEVFVAKKKIVVDLNASWNKKIDGSLVVKTPFQNFESNQISLRHNIKGRSLSTHGEAVIANKNVVVDLNADWDKNIDGSLVVTTPFQNFETNQISLRQKSKKGAFSFHGEAFVALKKVVVDASLKTGYATSGTFTFTSPIPGMESIKATLKKRGNADSLKGAIVLNVNKVKAQVNFQHKLSRTAMKSGLSISTPYTHTLKLSVDHSGPLDRFTNSMSLNYGRKVDIDSEASFTLGQSNINGNAMLKYKLGKGRNTVRISAKKNGRSEDMSFSGSASLNKDAISIIGSWKTVGEIDGSITINTPFKNFKATGMTLNHKGDMRSFQSNANVNYMDGKHIKGKVEYSNPDGKVIKFSSKLSSPFKALRLSSFDFNNEINEMINSAQGTIALSTTLNNFGTGTISYKKVGDIDNLLLESKVTKNRKDIAGLHMANSLDLNANVLHTKFDMRTVATPAIVFNVDHVGDVFRFNTKTSVTVGKNTISSEAKLKREYQSFDADGSVRHVFGNQVRNEGSVQIHTDGFWERFNVRLDGNVNDENIKLTASRRGALQDMTFSGLASYNGKSIDINGSTRNEAGISGRIDIETPFKNFNKVGLIMSHSGDASKFSSSATLNYMDNKKITGDMDLAANSVEDIKFTTSLATELKNYVDFKFNNQYERFTTNIDGNLAFSTPLFDIGNKAIRYSKTGDLNNLKMEIVTSDNGVEASSLKISNDYYGKELHSIFDFKSVSLPEILLAVDHEGGLTNMKTKAEAKFGKKSVITGQAKLNLKDNVIDCEGKVMYNVVSLGSNEGSMKIHKEGQMNDMTFDITANVGNKMSKLNGNFKNTDELSLAIQLTTPVKRFRNVGLSFKHSGSLDRFNCDGMIKVIDGKTFTGKINFYRYLLRRIEAVIEVTTPFKGLESTKYEYRHEGEEDNFKCISTLEYGNSKKIVYDLTATGSPNPDFKLTIVAPDMSLTSSGSVEYTWPKYGIKGRFDAEKGRVLTIDGSFDATSDILGALNINTPMERFTDVGLGFSYSERDNGMESRGQITYMDGKTISTKTDIAFSPAGGIKMSAELRTPFSGYEFTKIQQVHMISEETMKTTTTLIYKNDQTIVYEMSCSPRKELTVSLKTPFEKYEELLAYIAVDTSSPKYELNSQIIAGNGNDFSLAGSIDVSDEISGALKIATPYEGFTDIGMDFLHSGNAEQFGTEGKVTYMDGKTISTKTDIAFSRKGSSEMTAELRTPFSGFEFTKIQQVHRISEETMKTTTTLIYKNDQTIVYEMSCSPRKKLTVSLKTPFEKYEELLAYIAVDTSSPKYELNSKIIAGNGNDFSLAGSIDVSDEISGALKIATPYEGFTDIGMDFLHSGNAEKFDTEGKVTYMDGKDISGKVSFYKYMWRRIRASTELNTPFRGMEFTKAEMDFEDNTNSISMTTSLEYSDGKKFNGDLKLTYSPNYDMMVTLNTPFNGYKVIRTQGSLDITAPSYEMTYSMDNGHKKVYSATGKLSVYSINNVEASVEVNTPVSGLEYTKAEYIHKVDTSEIDGSMSLLYKNGQTMSADLKSSLSPNFDATLTVKTPFYGFENMQGSAAFEKSHNKYEASSSLNLGRGNLYSISSDVDFSSMRASTKVNTPFTEFSSLELTLTHAGEPNKFISTGHFTSPLTNDIIVKASVMYDSLFDMTALASLKSAMPGFDDMKAGVEMSTQADGRKAHLIMGWTEDQEIILDSVYHLQQSWYETKASGDISLSTPFTAVRKMAWQMEAINKEEVMSGKTNFDLNDNSLFDIEGEYQFKDKKEIQINLRQPSSMLYTASMARDGEAVNAEVFVNWNRNELDSNVRVQAMMNDKRGSQTENDIDVKLIHASRQYGLVHKINVGSSHTSSGGSISWDSADDNSKVFYDLQINDNSRRRKQMVDGSFKLGLPSRTLGLTGSFSDNKAAKAADVIFSWDADRDDSKQVGVKATVNRADGIKGGVTLSLPSLRKEIRVDGEVMMKNGRVLFDAKTDFSYSADARKTLTLTSKLEDITDYYTNYNYSMSLGVSHPYTNVDVQIKSHVGSSGERTTFGVDTHYMTAKRQMKSLALLTEINKLKKQINLLATGPMNKVEIVGDIVSTRPYKVRMINKINDMETFRSDVTVDQNKKSFVLNAFKDSEGLTVSAKYPNSTAFQADVTHLSRSEQHNDALLAVRLNTSRLMHTRLSWRPEMMEELNVLFLEKAMEDALNAKMALSEMNEAIKDEISAKYIAIADEVAEEIKPFIAALNVKLSGIAVRMSGLSTELRAMYNRNDFYVQSMGEEFMYIEEKLASLTQEYRENYRQLIRTMTQSLRDMRGYPIHEKYTQAVKESAQWVNQRVSQALTLLESMLEEMDKAIQEYQDKIEQTKKQALDVVYNATYVDYISNRIGQIGSSIDMSPYVASFDTDALYNASSLAMTSVRDLLEASQLGHVNEGMNEVYQQGLWAYHYWQLEENIRKHSHSIIQNLKEIIEDELKEYSEELQFLVKNPITVWDLKHGEIQADLPLPMVVKSLDKMPDFSPLVKKTQEMAAQYLPDKSTWNRFTKTVSDRWSVEEKNQKSKLPRKNRNKGRRFRVKLSKQ